MSGVVIKNTGAKCRCPAGRQAQSDTAPTAGRMTHFFYAAKAKQSLRAAWVFKRSFQNASSRRLALMQRRASTFSAPGYPQDMPDCLQREPMTVLHPASMTPEPMNKPWLRNVLSFHSRHIANEVGQLCFHRLLIGLAGVVRPVPEVHDLRGLRKIEPAHVFEAGSTIDEQDNPACLGQVAPNGFLPKDRAKRLQPVQARNISRRFVIPDRTALLVPAMLGKNASKVGGSCFGAAIGLLALAARQFLLAHRQTSGIGADIEPRRGLAFRQGLERLPPLPRLRSPPTCWTVR